jgi:hypothetical protein
MFQTLQNTFIVYVDGWTLTNKKRVLEKKDLAKWVFLAFKETSNLHNICNGVQGD